MKIGILTFHNACNFGAVLQCYALQETLINLGHEVKVIDYRNVWVEDIYKPFSCNVLRHYIHNPRTFVKYLLGYFRRKKTYTLCSYGFSEFVNKYIYLSKCKNIKCVNDFDYIIIGSDQLWGLSCLGGAFDDVYLGNFSHDNTKLIGYAISADLKSLQRLNESRQLSYAVDNFSAFSCREQTNADYICDVIGRKVDVCVDPTLLLPYSGWDKIVSEGWKKKNYIVLYQVRYTAGQKQLLINLAQKTAKSFGGDCTVVDLSNGYSVEDFVSAIKYAKLVITSSFHATVFSLIFKTNFYSIRLSDGHDDRYVSLLHELGLDGRIVDLENELPDVKQALPYYSLEKITYKSIDFLKCNLDDTVSQVKA